MSLAVGILLTYRLTLLITQENAPFGAFSRFRDWVGVEYNEMSQCVGRNEIARALCCFWCTSVYVGIGVSILMQEPLYWGLAVSGGAIIARELRAT